ncbi:MAG: DSD1 family PLP-dependent enzyme [Pseudomonadota bacterium]
MNPAQIPPARVGDPIADIDTPALLIDLDALEHNIAHMAELVADSPVAVRPHAKAHKTPAIALRQMAAGAKGICCQKVGEAEVMVAAGVPNVLVTNQIVGTPKLRRLAGLARQAWVGVCADDAGNIDALNDAALEVQATLNVLVEINVGSNRCGVAPGEPALHLARRIAAAPGLRFCGLQAYQGSAQHKRSPAEREALIGAAIDMTRETVALLERNGLSCEIVTGAGTGTFPLEQSSDLYNELQVGSYIFMDADYRRNEVANGRPFREFEASLYVLCSVVSQATPGRCVVDAGHKSNAVDSGMPEPVWPDTTYSRPSDEHGLLTLGANAPALSIGDKVRLIPGHCDPTVNLYDWMVGVRRERVEVLWPVLARGAAR